MSPPSNRVSLHKSGSAKGSKVSRDSLHATNALLRPWADRQNWNSVWTQCIKDQHQDEKIRSRRHTIGMGVLTSEARSHDVDVVAIVCPCIAMIDIVYSQKLSWCTTTQPLLINVKSTKSRDAHTFKQRCEMQPQRFGSSPTMPLRCTDQGTCKSVSCSL